MAFLRFADDAAMYDSTPPDNMFIIENLPSAPEAFLKVYIYARMLCMHPELGGVEELSRALRLDDEMIENAFAYWERVGFMRRVADNPPEYVFIPARGSTISEMDRDYYKYRDFNGELQSLFPAGKLIHPAQYGMANDWLNVYGFEQGAVIALVKHTIANSKSKNPDPARIFKSAEKKVQELAKKVDKYTRDVLHYLGMFREPTDAETELATKWVHEWKLTLEEVLDACRETVKAHNPTFAYLDTILANRLDKSGSSAFDNMRAVFRIMGVTSNPSMEQRKWYEQQLADGFEHETVMLAARVQSQRTYPSFGGLTHMLERWKAKGLYKYADANGFVTRGQELLSEFTMVLTNAGIEKRPNEDDLAAYEAWRQTVPAELIQLAADNSKGRSYPLSYLFALLDRWSGMGITDVESAKNELAGKRQPRQAAQPKENPALSYQQRDYNNDDFDGDAFMEEARRLIEQQDTGTGVN